jgi:uncharacterized Tic20 family protein
MNQETPNPAASPTTASGEPRQDERSIAMLAHLLGIFTQFLGPLIIWLIKKDSSEFINDQAKEALNFQITFILAWIISGILVAAVIGCFLLPVVAICNIVFCIMGAVAANKGQRYRYPLALRLIK